MFTCNKPYTNTNISFNKWDFELSDFQKHSIHNYLEGGNILITANTGSGKTLPAEFAMEHCVNVLKKKVIYTTPIIALTNEKFYAFKNKYPEISFGILTGPEKFNRDADVLIMTTEILNNTLYKKSIMKDNEEKSDKIILDFDMDIHNDLGLVIYDEIHYINDEHRGSVWEESIMRLPNSVQTIGLSATINNPQKICELLHNSNNKNTFLCPHNKRIVPLEHYLFVCVTNSTIKNMIKNNRDKYEPIMNQFKLFKDPDNNFNTDMYHNTNKLLSYISKNKIKINRYYVINKAIELCKEKNMLPALCFIFSKKQCEEYANKVTIPLFDAESKIPSIIKNECIKVLSKFPNYKEYTALPEFNNLVKLLEKGIGIHHAGMLSPFREMVELLYSKKYIRLLFATETFAVGINMPIRTVIYTSMQKFDGSCFRYLHPHEYSQGSGRAGRRGIDTKGYVIHCNNLFHSNHYPYLDEYKHIMNGEPEKIKSKLKINFNIVLKTISSNVGIKDFVKNSMLQKEIDQEILGLSNQKKTLRDETDIIYSSLKNLRTDINQLIEFDSLKESLNSLNNKKRKVSERKMTCIKNENKFFEQDYGKYLKYKDKEIKTKQIDKMLYNTQHYIHSEFSVYLDILLENNFLENTQTNQLILTVKGDIAMNIHEINSLAITDIITVGCLNNLKTKEIVAILSIFTDIRLSDENRINYIEDVNIPENVKNIIVNICEKIDKYNHLLDTCHVNYTKQHINYDMCEYLYNWCDVTNETESQQIYTNAKQWGISIGDFTKAI